MAKLEHSGDWVLKVAIPVPIRRLFDYLAPETVDPSVLQPGIRLKVPFGKNSKIAFLVEVSRGSEVDTGKLKRAEAILDDKPLLDESDLKLLHWVKLKTGK